MNEIDKLFNESSDEDLKKMIEENALDDAKNNPVVHSITGIILYCGNLLSTNVPFIVDKAQKILNSIEELVIEMHEKTNSKIQIDENEAAPLGLNEEQIKRINSIKNTIDEK